MKRNFILLSILLISTCNSFGQNKRVALVTFYVDKYIHADNIAETARQSTYEMTKKDDPRFDLRPILESFHKTFIESYTKELPFDIIPEEKVTGHQYYKAYKGLDGIEDQDSIDDILESIDERFIAIEGYNVLLTGGNMLRSWRTESHLMTILQDLEIDGVLFVSMHFAWEPKVAYGGLGNAGIRAFITMELYNKEAKKVMKLEEYATSKTSVPLISGAPVLDYEKMLPMCQNASERLVVELNEKLKKITSKVDKNL